MNNRVPRSYDCQEINRRMTSTQFAFLIILSVALLAAAH